MRSTQSFALTCLAALSSAAALRDSTTPYTLTRQHARDLAFLQKRGNCGPGVGSCSPNECCSQYGWCGTSADHCGTGCQSQFGTCSGTGGGSGSGNTGGVPRPKFGSVGYGVSIATCTVPGTIAITYDDGPFTYTAQLLDILAQHNAKATFFINGRNWGDTRQYGDVLRRFIADGHQVASHTYAHPDLNTIDSAARRQQMIDLEAIFKDFYGFVPTYMRPPYGNCNGACLTDMADLGYHVIMWNIDTLDYANQSPQAIQNSKAIFDGAVSTDASRNAYISLEHDVHPYTVSELSAHILQTARNRGYRLVTVGECLGDPSGNWYRDAVTGNAVGGGGSDGGDDGGDGGNSGGLTVTPDGTCGGTTGFTCTGSWSGNCCSQWGWCGNSDAHCGGGCQPGFGTCN